MENTFPIYSSLTASELQGLSAETSARMTSESLPTTQNVENLTPVALVGQGRLSVMDTGLVSPTQTPSNPLEGPSKGRG